MGAEVICMSFKVFAFSAVLLFLFDKYMFMNLLESCFQKDLPILYSKISDICTVLNVPGLCWMDDGMLPLSRGTKYQCFVLLDICRWEGLIAKCMGNFQSSKLFQQYKIYHCIMFSWNDPKAVYQGYCKHKDLCCQYLKSGIFSEVMHPMTSFLLSLSSQAMQ